MGRYKQSITSENFELLLEDARNYLVGKNVYVRDGAVGADPATCINTRVITEKAYSSLFVHNMFLRFGVEQIENADPAWHVICVPEFEANPERHGCRQGNVSAIDFTRKIMNIAGSGYTGEIKKGYVLSDEFCELPEVHGVLPMHCSSNVGKDGNVAVFFGLSGTERNNS